MYRVRIVERLNTFHFSGVNMKELYKALLAAQKDMEPLKRDANNPFTKSKYATLAAVQGACFPSLNKHGIVVVQRAESGEAGHVVVVTCLVHSESGEMLESSLCVPMAKNDAQGMGSAITYGRRYQLMAMCGLAPEDDDGSAASARSNQRNSRPQRTVSPDDPTYMTWLSPDEAYAWSVDNGYCANVYEARNSLKKIVNGSFGGSMTKSNAAAVFEAFYNRQINKKETGEDGSDE